MTNENSLLKILYEIEENMIENMVENMESTTAVRVTPEMIREYYARHPDEVCDVVCSTLVSIAEPYDTVVGDVLNTWFRAMYLRDD